MDRIKKNKIIMKFVNFINIQYKNYINHFNNQILHVLIHVKFDYIKMLYIILVFLTKCFI